MKRSQAVAAGYSPVKRKNANASIKRWHTLGAQSEAQMHFILGVSLLLIQAVRVPLRDAASHTPSCRR
ncbi:hypothetical protein IAG25_31240 [Caballeronia sp. EK]|uniref:hypothetical protein n=1 Tax=Caballeronia sp. EK TaxID=2767469 RepID=UPI0016550024|nr:hypothetical protein [Caballeronia sp. EK]MBC8641297.1 hypothetical protein [Caballeronia sp. EK]